MNEQRRQANCETTGSRLLIGVGAAVTSAFLFDVGIYRGHGPAGWALFFSGSLIAYFLGTLTKDSLKSAWVITVMLLLLAFRLLWLGNPWLCFLGLVLLPVFAMARNGFIPYLTDVLVYISTSLLSGVIQVFRSRNLPSFGTRPIKLQTVLAYGLPVGAVFLFGAIFIAANPDLSKTISDFMQSAEKWLTDFLMEFDLGEIVLVGMVFWLVLGQLCPVFHHGITDTIQVFQSRTTDTTPREAALYQPIRNTLLAVIGLFAVYLAFEFSTLWFREFPEGFYYAGYAHQGAAWLTFALALATAMLSLIFQGATLADPRIEKLKRLAWIWSIANLLLAMAVYNRMWIYINFNGMTRMRVVGLFGITTVIAGFLLVVWKIRTTRSFLWLIQRQLWALGIAGYLLSIAPTDYIIHTYNTREILFGNLAPAVQITEHPVDASGWLALVPLIDCEDEIIRDGIRAKLAQFLQREGKLYSESRNHWSQHQDHWTSFQLVQRQLLAELNRSKKKLAPYQDEDHGRQLWLDFRDYAYQWY